MRESVVEKLLKNLLEAHGFKVIKLTCPGTNGVPDRLILRPTWSPGSPWVLEVKAPGEKERRLQVLVREEWISRGVLVLDVCDSVERAHDIAESLYITCLEDRQNARDI